MSDPNYTGPGSDQINNFEGGEPSARDIVPAIIFTVLLGLSIPLLAWRMFSGKHKSYILINSALFFLTRLASLIMRAYMSRHSYGPNIVIAQTVLLTIGWLFLLNGLIDLWQRHVMNARDDVADTEYGNEYGHHHGDRERTLVEHKERNVKWVKYFASFLRLLLLVALACIIAAGALFSTRLDENEQTDAVHNLIKVTYILGLAASAIGVISTIITHFVYNRSKKRTGFILSYSIPLLVSSIYRVVEVFTGYRATSRQLAAFWVALILMELIAYGLTLAVSLPKWFGNLKERMHRRRPSDQEKLHGAGAGRASSVDGSQYAAPHEAGAGSAHGAAPPMGSVGPGVGRDGARY